MIAETVSGMLSLLIDTPTSIRRSAPEVVCEINRLVVIVVSLSTATMAGQVPPRLGPPPPPLSVVVTVQLLLSPASPSALPSVVAWAAAALPESSTVEVKS